MNRAPEPTRPDRVVPFDEARRIAQTNGWREKTLIYLTRHPDELLVLEHTEEYPDAGVQVPAGGVDPGELPDRTARRELAEETGLIIDTTPTYLESRVWSPRLRGVQPPSMVRHYFWIAAPLETPDRWSHVVSAGEADKGMVFWLRFQPRKASGLTPGYGWDAALGRLDAAIRDA